MVTRYDLEIYSQGAAGNCAMEEDKEGCYVLYYDYQKLEARIKELEKRVSDQSWEIEASRQDAADRDLQLWK